jgi:hypothetical protein
LEPSAWVQQTGALGAIKTLFDGYFSELCGLTPLQHVHFGPIAPGSSEYYIRAKLADMSRTVELQFRKTI